MGLEQAPFIDRSRSRAFVRRPRAWMEVIAHLLDPPPDKRMPNSVALWGAGGYGKTTLAVEICREMQRRAAFPDGIVWVYLGEGLKKASDDFQMATRRLGGLLDSRILIVVDDLWNQDDVRDFIAYYSQNCSWLITTRDQNTLEDIVPEERQVRVNQMRRIEAINLLGTGIKDKSTLCPVRHDLKDLAEQLGRWPLGLELIGNSLTERVIRGKPLLETIKALKGDLRQKGLSKFDAKKVVAATLKVSLKQVKGKDRARFRDLAVFPEGVSIPLTTVERFWEHTAGLDTGETEDLCVRLDKLSLLKKVSFDPTKAGIQLHNEISKYLIDQQKNKLTDLDNQLLNSHPKNRAWAEMPDDEPYFWDHLAFHLIRAGRRSELVETVKHWRWLVTKTQKGKAIAVETDLGEAVSIEPEDSTLRRLQRAFGNSSRWFERAAEGEIEAKLYGRLQHLRDSLMAMPEDLAEGFKVPYIAVRFDFPDVLGNPDPVKSCNFSYDRSQMVTVSYDGTLKIWDTQTGKPLPPLQGHPKPVNGCAFSPDGSRIVSALSDDTLIVWDLKSGEVVQTLIGHLGLVTSCAFSPDGSLIVSASLNKALRVWDAPEGRIRRIFKRFVRTWKENDFSGRWEEDDVRIDGHEGGVNDCAFSPDGKWIASASDDKTLKVWDVESGKLWRTLVGHSGAVNRCGFSQDGKYLVSASSDRTLRIWNAQTWRIFRTLPPEPKSEPGGTKGFPEDRKTSEGHEGDVNDGAFSVDDRLVVSASSDGTVKVWEVESGKCLATFCDNGEMMCCRMDGRMIYAGGAYGLYFLELVQSGRGETTTT